MKLAEQRKEDGNLEIGREIGNGKKDDEEEKGKRLKG